MRCLAKACGAFAAIRLFALLLGSFGVPSTAFFACIGAALPAQDLIWVEGEYGTVPVMKRLNPNAVGVSPVLSTTVLSAIPTTQRMRGITLVGLDGTTSSAPEFFVYAEQSDGTSHFWRVDHLAGTATTEVSPLLWGDAASSIRPADMIAFARTPLGVSPVPAGSPAAWHTTISTSGALHAPWLEGFDIPIGATSTPGSGSLPFAGPHVGGMQYGHHALVGSHPSVMTIKMVQMPGGPSGPTAPVVLQSWTLPVSGQLLGFTVAPSGVLYAVVNRFASSTSPTGYVELVRSTQPLLDAETLTLESVGSHIQDWSNGDAGPISFPSVQLVFVAP